MDDPPTTPPMVGGLEHEAQRAKFKPRVSPTSHTALCVLLGLSSLDSLICSVGVSLAVGWQEVSGEAPNASI
jgi:hypothetical protein